MRLLALPLLALATPAMAQAPADMLLICDGATLQNIPESDTSVAVVDNQGYAIAGRAATRSPATVEFTVRFEIDGGNARLGLPDGWRKVRDLSVDDRRITGKVRYGLLNSSTFEIDRVTGTMHSSNGFHGHCRPEDLTQRAF